MYDIVISSSFLIGLMALTVILQLSELMWYLQLAIQLWFSKENEGKIAYPGELHLLDDFSNRCCKSTEFVRAMAIIVSITSISSCCNWHAFSIGKIMHLTRSHWVRSCYHWKAATWLNIPWFQVENKSINIIIFSLLKSRKYYSFFNFSYKSKKNLIFYVLRSIFVSMIL